MITGSNIYVIIEFSQQPYRYMLFICTPFTTFYFYLFFNFHFYIGAQFLNNVVLISGVQQSDSVIHIHLSILFQILFLFRLLHRIEQSSLLCATAYRDPPALNHTHNSLLCPSRSLLVIHLKSSSV